MKEIQKSSDVASSVGIQTPQTWCYYIELGPICEKRSSSTTCAFRKRVTAGTWDTWIIYNAELFPKKEGNTSQTSNLQIKNLDTLSQLNLLRYSARVNLSPKDEV